jgi:NAD(P)H dehydrogenase (quinone)
VALLAYTSVLRADTTPLGLAAEHVVTEAASARRACPTLSCAMAGTWKTIRNTWRPCSSMARAGRGAGWPLLVGRASRLRGAAAAVLTAAQPQAIYELAGDHGFT